MIVLNLTCSGGHHFEGWFASVDAFTEQSEAGLVVCPTCNNAEIMRLPVAPMVRRHAAEITPASLPRDSAGRDLVQQTLVQQTLARLAADADDVGDRFAEEARRIHYHEIPERSIRGQASLHETHALLEEGIVVLPVPAKKDDLN
jgi:hypothetical protein